MMKQLLVAALAVSAHAALFIQQSDFGANFRYTTSAGTNPLNSAAFTDSVNGITPTGYSFYNPYGIRYYNGESRGFAPTGNWLLVTDPISNNYGDYSSPIFTIPYGGTTGTTVGGFSVLQVPSNPFSTFHSVVIAAGPESRWTGPGDIVLFQPSRNISAQLQAYNPLDLFSYQLGVGANSVQTTANTPNGIPITNTFTATGTPSYGVPFNWICLGQQMVVMNQAGDSISTAGAPGPATQSQQTSFYTRGTYCLVSEDDVVARVDLSPDSGYPSLQRSLVNRLDALHSEPTEFGLTTLA